MRKNVGSVDSVIRYVLGVIIIALGFIYHSWWGLIGLIPIVTAAIHWCPLYAPFKISTVKKEQSA